MTGPDLLIYSLSLAHMALAVGVAVLYAFAARGAEHHRWTGAATFALVAFLLGGEALERLGVQRAWPFFTAVQIGAIFLLGPAILAYARSVSPFRLPRSPWRLLEFLPAAVVLAVVAPLFSPKTEATNPTLAQLWPILWPAIVVQIGLSIAVAIRLAFRDLGCLRQVLSFSASGYELRLRRLLLMMALPWALFAAEEVVTAVAALPEPVRIALGVARMLGVLAVCFLAIFPTVLVPAPQQPRPGGGSEDFDPGSPTSREPRSPEQPTTENGPTGRYARAPLSAEAMEQIAERIQHALVEDGLYQNPLLTLGGLSRHLRLPQHALSQTMNVHLGKSFFDLVNEARIRHVLTALREGRQETLLDLALEAGFNSKSTFNAAFKRVTSQTPSQMRRNLRKHA